MKGNNTASISILHLSDKVVDKLLPEVRKLTDRLKIKAHLHLEHEEKPTLCDKEYVRLDDALHRLDELASSIPGYSDSYSIPQILRDVKHARKMMDRMGEAIKKADVRINELEFAAYELKDRSKK